MKLIKKFLTTMKTFDSLMHDLKFRQLHDTNKDTQSFEYFSEKIDLDLNENLIESESYKIDNDLFQKIIDKLLLLRQKFNFMFSYKQKFYLELLAEREKISSLRNSLESELDIEVKNLLDSKILKSSGKYMPIEYNCEFKDGFEIVGNNVEPIFANVKLLKTNVVSEGNNRLVIRPVSSLFVSKMTFSFNHNIKDQIVIAYKNFIDGDIVYTSPQIELSKDKTISLNFENCAEILIYANGDLLKELININIYGSDSLIDLNSSAGIISLNSSTPNLLIEAEDSMKFYKTSTKNLPNDLLHNDFANNQHFTPIPTNILTNVDYKVDEKIIVLFNTEKPLLDVPKFYTM